MLFRLLALTITAAVALGMAGCGGSTVAVPDVSGFEYRAAERALQDARLVPSKAEWQDEYTSPGVVSKTDPEAGAQVDEQSTVTVYVAVDPSGSDTRATDTETAAEAPLETDAEATAEPTLSCDYPEPGEIAALRYTTTLGSGKDLADSPFVLVKDGEMNYIAGVIAETSPQQVVLASFPEKGAYLSGMKAVNGTARMLTDLPDGPQAMPAGGSKALDCIG